jgi:hypothetical protein
LFHWANWRDSGNQIQAVAPSNAKIAGPTGAGAVPDADTMPSSVLARQNVLEHADDSTPVASASPSVTLEAIP